MPRPRPIENMTIATAALKLLRKIRKKPTQMRGGWLILSWLPGKSN